MGPMSNDQLYLSISFVLFFVFILLFISYSKKQDSYYSPDKNNNDVESKAEKELSALKAKIAQEKKNKEYAKKIASIKQLRDEAEEKIKRAEIVSKKANEMMKKSISSSSSSRVVDLEARLKEREKEVSDLKQKLKLMEVKVSDFSQRNLNVVSNTSKSNVSVVRDRDYVSTDYGSVDAVTFDEINGSIDKIRSRFFGEKSLSKSDMSKEVIEFDRYLKSHFKGNSLAYAKSQIRSVKRDISEY